MYTNTCKEKTFYYISKKVIEANHNEVNLTLIKERNLTKLNSKVQLILIIVKYNKVILSNFKIVKFNSRVKT